MSNQTDKMRELLPCPCCAGMAEFNYHDDDYSGPMYYWIECTKCGLSTETDSHNADDCRDRLAESWNKRIVQAAQSAAVPVVGDVVAWVRKDQLQHVNMFGPALCHVYAAEQPGTVALIVQPTTSITTAELYALRKDAERGRLLIEHGEWIRRNHDTDEAYAMLAIRLPYSADLSCNPMREYAIDAAIAGEKKNG